MNAEDSGTENENALHELLTANASLVATNTLDARKIRAGKPESAGHQCETGMSFRRSRGLPIEGMHFVNTRQRVYRHQIDIGVWQHAC